MYGMVIIVVIHSFNNDDPKECNGDIFGIWDRWIREGVYGSCNAACETYIAGQACLMSRLFYFSPFLELFVG